MFTSINVLSNAKLKEEICRRLYEAVPGNTCETSVACRMDGNFGPNGRSPME